MDPLEVFIMKPSIKKFSIEAQLDEFKIPREFNQTIENKFNSTKL